MRERIALFQTDRFEVQTGAKQGVKICILDSVSNRLSKIRQLRAMYSFNSRRPKKRSESAQKFVENLGIMKSSSPK